MESSPRSGGGGLPAPPAPRGRGGREPSLRAILRVVASVVASAFALYLIYRLRTPISWLLFAIFIAVAVSAPINRLSQRMPRGAAIALVYTGLILVPVIVGAILLPPAVEAGSSLVSNFPGYVADVNEFVQDNDRLRDLNENFDLTQKLDELANDAAGGLDDAAAALADVGAGILGSLFALFTIIVMSIFIVSRGRGWAEALLRTRPDEEADVIRRALERMAIAVSSYVGGAILQALIAGITAFTVLAILGVPAPLALAVIIALLDLIPLVGATIGATLVAGITLFDNFPTATIVWVVFAIAYQQFENYVIQPRIQSRAVELDPFVIVVAAIFGGTLLGVVGALLAIPVAAAAQIGIKEFRAYRRSDFGQMDGGEGPDSDSEVPGEGSAAAGGPAPSPG